jgi:hypothetical protein
MALGGFAAGLALGVNAGRQLRKDWDDRSLRGSLAEAAETAPTVTESLSGPEAEALSRENFVPQDGGPQTFEEHAASLGDSFSPERAKSYDVGKQSFAKREDASLAEAAGLANAQAKAYRAHGYPEQAVKLQAADLEMRGGQRKDEIDQLAQPVRKKQLGLEMANVENQLATMKQDFLNRVNAGKLKGIDLQKSIFGAFADAAEKNPVFANQMLKDPDVLKGMGITDASYTPDKKGLIFTLEDGQRASATFDNLQAWRNGKGELQYKVLGEGDELVAYDAKGNAKTVASVAKKIDPSKNDAAQDDAVAVMTRFLETNKNMMTQFGGNEQKAREEMRLAHDKGIGEFKRRSGRAPTVEEAAIIAEGSFNRAKQKYLGGK